MEELGALKCPTVLAQCPPSGTHNISGLQKVWASLVLQLCDLQHTEVVS